jgi:hypothetical protein
MGKKQRRKVARTGAGESAPITAPEVSPAPGGSTKGRLDPSRRPGTRPRRKPASRLPWIVGIGGVLLLVGITIASNMIREANLPGERFRSQGNVHVALGTQTPPYNTEPPTSGWHTPGIAGWGAYVDAAPHDQELVHNMEDGGVILWYVAGTPDENAAHVEALQNVLGSRWPRTVIAPREGLESPYVLTAWTRMQRFEELDPDGKRAFVTAYHGLDHHPR